MTHKFKFLSPRVHAPLDYGLVAGFALGPLVLGFSGIAATLSLLFAALVLAGALFTAYPGGIVKLVPFPLHGYAELAFGLLFLAVPFIFGFADAGAPRNLFFVMGIGTVLVFIVTDYKAATAPRAPRPMS